MVHGERRHRDGILSAARKLIYARGYADVGVAEICADAGVKKSSFCPFFPSQRDPILAVLESALADLKSDLLDRAFAADVSPLQRLRRFVELTTRFQAQRFNETGTVPGCQFGNLAAERATQDEVLHDRVDAVFRRLAAVLSVTLDEAVHAGELDPIDPAPRAAAMLAYVEGVMLMAKARNDPVVLAQLLPAMPDIRIEPARD